MPKLTTARTASPATIATALCRSWLGQSGIESAQQEMRREQAEAGHRQQPRFLEQGGMQAVIEMAEEAEQAGDADRDQDAVAGAEAEQQDQHRGAEARRAEREQA